MEKIPAKRPHRIFAVVKGRLKKKDLRKKGQKKAEMEFEPSEAAACLNTHTTHFVAPFHAQEPVAVPVTKATFYWVDFPCSWKIEKILCTNFYYRQIILPIHSFSALPWECSCNGDLVTGRVQSSSAAEGDAVV